jgi:hypothetical protein
MNGKLQSGSTPAALAGWRLQDIGVLRIVFGLVWALDAWFKWQPDFINNFTDYGGYRLQRRRTGDWVAGVIGDAIYSPLAVVDR